MNIKEKISSVISEAYPDLKNLQDDYFIIGSSALILLGVGIENTFDVDILMTDRDANSLKDTWKDRIEQNYITQHDDLFRSNFSRYRFDNLDVEVMGNLEVNKNGVWIPLAVQDFITFKLNDISIKIPTLKEQIRILCFFGREKDKEKVRLINEFNLSDK